MKKTLLLFAALLALAALPFAGLAADEKKAEKPKGKEAGKSEAASESKWLTDFDAAKKTAKEKKLPILVDFSGSDWCGWCVKLEKEVFSKAEFQSYAKDNLVLFLADFPKKSPQPDEVKKQNKALLDKFKVEGFPTVILMDAEGKELARTGYKNGGPEAYVKHLKELLSSAKK